ncbi:MAG: DJ-1/PfpI family protein [Patescibacteria group bacterium]|nr:DJ-1/PfpI family protein [Patescibacteria group bacterium]
MEEKKLSGKNILMIIASRNFRDEEYFIPFEIFQKAGAKITTASSVKGEVVGIEGGEARSTLTLEKVAVRNFNAVVFIGGEGTKEYFENETAHKIVQDTVNANKILAAICIAPVILAKAGVLKGKTATVWSSIANKSGKEELEKAGCTVSEQRIERNEKIITADGPAVAGEFAETVIKALTEKANEEI